ncbi:Nn.00g021030.m01.CDS01 [Neocucurbitaria sp. VM-36]
MALEVAAGVIGILAANGKVAEKLAPIVSAYRDCTRNAAAILSEINNVRFTLVSLHALFPNINEAPQRRRRLIQVDQLITSLTDGVLLFSELEAIATRLDSTPTSMGAKIGWARKDYQLVSLVSRMQRFQISMSLMLNILQCISDVEADHDQQKLLSVTTALLESNLELTKRIAHLEEDFHTMVDSSKSTCRRASFSAIDTTASVPVNSILEDLRNKPSSMPTEATRTSQYESDLDASRVYRKVRRITSLLSFRSSVALTHAWTALSDVSLSDISVISVVALPLTRDEIDNQHHYDFPGEIHQSQLRPPSSTAAGSGPIPQAPRKIEIVVKGTTEAEINKLVATFVGPQCVIGSDDSIINCYETLCVVDGITVYLEILVITDLYGIDTDRQLRNAQNYVLVSSMRSDSSQHRVRKDKLRIDQWKGNAFYTLIRVQNHFDRDVDSSRCSDRVDGVEYHCSSPSASVAGIGSRGAVYNSGYPHCYVSWENILRSMFLFMLSSGQDYNTRRSLLECL